MSVAQRQAPGTVSALKKVANLLSRPLRWILGVSTAFVLFWGTSIVVQGMFLGILTVVGMWVTIERIPGVRALARTDIGMMALSIAAAFLVHLVIGTSTVTGMFAAATALVVKYFVLTLEAGEKPVGKNGLPVIVAAGA